MLFTLRTVDDAPEADKARTRKTRTFEAQSPGWVRIAPQGGHGSPASTLAFLTAAASPSALQPFLANARSRQPLRLTGDPESPDLRWDGEATYTVSRHEAGPDLHLAALAHPLTHLEPPPQREALRHIRFLALAPQSALDSAAERFAEHPERFEGDDPREAATATLFAAYLSRRTPLPVLGDPRFHQRLYRHARDHEWALGTDAEAVEKVGLEHLAEPIFVSITASAFAEILSELTIDFTADRKEH